MPVSHLTAAYDFGHSEAAERRVRACVARSAVGHAEFARAYGHSALASGGPKAVHAEGVAFAAAWVHGPPPTSSISEHGVPTAGASVFASAEGLSLSRGPFGGRPLYFTCDGAGEVLACTQLAPIVSDLPRLEFDRDVLAALILADTPRDAGATCYRGIRRVGPCETVRFTGRTSRSSFDLPEVPHTRSGSADDLAGELRDRLVLAIKRAVGDARSVAVFAGGGVDSSGLFAALVTAPFEFKVRTVAMAFDFDGPGSDRPHLVELLRHLNAEALREPPAQVSGLVSSSLSLDAAPFTWPTGPMEVGAARGARRWGAEVILTGALGDMVLEGPPGHLAERVRRGDVSAFVDALRLVESHQSTPGARVSRHLVKPLLHPAIPAFLLRQRRRMLHHRAVRRSAAWAWGGPVVRRILAASPLETTTPDRLTGWAISPWLAEVADARGQLEGEAACDIADPYLDCDFATFMASVAPEMLFHGNRSRGLFRHAMRGLLPESLRVRSDKASFEPAFDAIVAGMGGIRAFSSLLTMEATADLGLVEPSAFRTAFEEQVRGTPSNRGWLGIWPAVAVEAFLRRSNASDSPLDFTPPQPS